MLMHPKRFSTCPPLVFGATNLSYIKELLVPTKVNVLFLIEILKIGII